LLSCLPNPLFKCDDGLNGRFCRRRMGLHSGTIHSPSVTHAAGRRLDCLFRIMPETSRPAVATAQHT
jgi:hypothetical protein